MLAHLVITISTSSQDKSNRLGKSLAQEIVEIAPVHRQLEHPVRSILARASLSSLERLP